jgi:branched-chain amino acid transport system substrate-binding protein
MRDDIVIVSATRTPVGAFNGALSSLPAHDLGKVAITAALESSTFSDHFMPYSPTKFVNGQNTGAQPLMTQVIQGDIRVIVPREYREADPIFPMRA